MARVLIELLCGYWTNKKENILECLTCANDFQGETKKIKFYLWFEFLILK